MRKRTRISADAAGAAIDAVADRGTVDIVGFVDNHSRDITLQDGWKR